MKRVARPLAQAVWTLLCAATLASCADGPDPAQGEFWRPWYDTVDASEPVDPTDPPPDLAGPADLRPPDRRDMGSPDLASMPGSCSLAVTVTTVSPGGRYSPRNIGAIWVSDSSNRFIKTLNVWADKRAKYLKQWNQATAAASVPASRTDAISGATKSSHGVRTGTWNCTNTASVPVADGSYKVCFELTDYDGQGPYDCVAFTKSPAPVSLTPADAPSFTARKLELNP